MSESVLSVAHPGPVGDEIDISRHDAGLRRLQAATSEQRTKVLPAVAALHVSLKAHTVHY